MYDDCYSRVAKVQTCPWRVLAGYFRVYSSFCPSFLYRIIVYILVYAPSPVVRVHHQRQIASVTRLRAWFQLLFFFPVRPLATPFAQRHLRFVCFLFLVDAVGYEGLPRHALPQEWTVLPVPAGDGRPLLPSVLHDLLGHG